MAEKKKKTPKKKKSKGGSWAVVVITALLTVVIGIVALSWFGERLPEKVQKITGGEATSREVKVYFTSEDGLGLKAEVRKIAKGPAEVELKEALSTLLGGPKDNELANPVPDGVRILSVKVESGIATVDFSRELSLNHPGGAAWEIQTVYSIVNTVAMNFTDIKKVQILVDGRREKTVSGHIDISRPLAPDTKIIKG